MLVHFRYTCGVDWSIRLDLHVILSVTHAVAQLHHAMSRIHREPRLSTGCCPIYGRNRSDLRDVLIVEWFRTGILCEIIIIKRSCTIFLNPVKKKQFLETSTIFTWDTVYMHRRLRMHMTAVKASLITCASLNTTGFSPPNPVNIHKSNTALWHFVKSRRSNRGQTRAMSSNVKSASRTRVIKWYVLI